MNLSDFLALLPHEATKGNGETMCQCPCHQDRKASLSVKQGDKGIILHCHAGCQTKDSYKGGRASSYVLRVDGNVVPASAIVNGEVDIVPYLSTHSDGKIRRNTWHSIAVTPNALTRVVMRRYCKVFIQSIGGGDH